MTTADRTRLHRLAITAFIFLAVLVAIQAGGLIVQSLPDYEPFQRTITLNVGSRTV